MRELVLLLALGCPWFAGTLVVICGPNRQVIRREAVIQSGDHHYQVIVPNGVEVYAPDTLIRTDGCFRTFNAISDARGVYKGTDLPCDSVYRWLRLNYHWTTPLVPK